MEWSLSTTSPKHNAGYYHHPSPGFFRLSLVSYVRGAGRQRRLLQTYSTGLVAEEASEERWQVLMELLLRKPLPGLSGGRVLTGETGVMKRKDHMTTRKPKVERWLLQGKTAVLVR